MTDGERLFALRRERGLTLEEAARKVGIHKSTLCRYEEDEIPVRSGKMLGKLCRLYQVGPECFSRGREREEKLWSKEKIAAAWGRLDERGQLRIQNSIRCCLREGGEASE